MAREGEDLEDVEDAEDGEPYIAGDDYYSSVRFFHKYNEDFNTVTDGRNNTDKHGVKCNHINTTFFQGSDFSDRCYKVAKYLDHINEEKVEERFDRCKFLNYFLNTDKHFNTFSNHDKSQLFKAYKYLPQIDGTCYSYIESIENEDVLKKLKKLYHLYDSLNHIEKFITSPEGDICNHAKQFASVYWNNEYNCHADNSDGYCIQLKSIEQSFYQHMKDKKCPEAENILEFIVSHNRTTATVVSYIIILTIPFFLFVLYKFTPFGSWVNTEILKKREIWNNLSEETQLKNPRHEQLNIQNSKYSLNYHVV
ncbi:PIR protein [Plasmodium ovale]|uniref:PIR protein n=1 Tax=Plasmodium ovale TaxID=36330 RepID=A0A1D3JGN4_PLAOA|nr:PIR protein [Plasmodium ovale]